MGPIPNLVRQGSLEIDHVVDETGNVHDDLDVGVDLGDRLLGRQRLRATDVGHAVDDLALEVGLVDLVELRDAERADTGRGEVEQGGRAQAAGTDDQHLGVLQPLLPAHAHVGDDQVAAVAAHLVDGELGGGLDQCFERHVFSLTRVSVQQHRRPPCSPRTSNTRCHVPRYGRCSRPTGG